MPFLDDPLGLRCLLDREGLINVRPYFGFLHSERKSKALSTTKNWTGSVRNQALPSWIAWEISARAPPSGCTNT
eukprot:scaffold97_cov261-Pinguiococcus_pyrenoidosus.AAC.25